MPSLPRRPDDGCATFYGVIVACVTLILLSILAATISIGKACAFAVAGGMLLGIVGCLTRTCAHAGGTEAPSAGVLPTTTAARPAACGLLDAAIDALLAFAYARPVAEGGDGKSDDAGRCAPLCAVCLEDVGDGEMVRRLPACRHLFHLECVDMWLHSHSTCPLFRCDVAPPPVNLKPTAADAAAVHPTVDALPPV